MENQITTTSPIQKGKTFLSSSAGLIAALAIIVLFVLAATFFKSVVFGLLLAYLFLPLQLFYKNHLFNSKIVRRFSSFLSFIFFPITKPLTIIKNKIFKNKNLDLSEYEKREKKLIAKSCKLTIFTVFLIFLFCLSGIGWISTSYLTSATKSISDWARTTTVTYEGQKKLNTKNEVASTTKVNHDEDYSFKQVLKALSYKFEEIKPKLDKIAFFRLIKSFIKTNLSNPESIRSLLGSFFDKSGGFFSYTAGAIGTVFFILFNTLFTFFFFAFFLNKLAIFRSKVTKKTTPGQYITEALLNSAWAPHTAASTKEHSTEILDNILNRLKIWLRGYCIIIVIESCFYMTSFTLIGVPFGLILGLIAGFTILLPYIGPILSALLTITICLTLGNMSFVQIIFVILSYIIMTGILDQLFIYPAIVGSSLGLNELETIVVVLLGGMLFGITGMIFAVPTVSIIKYLIPEVYKLIETK